MAKERRQHGRYRLWLPARLSCDGRELMAVGHDMSRHGALMLTEVALAMGASLRISLRIPPEDGPELDLRAEVVRCEPNREDKSGLWPFEIAVRFFAEEPKIEDRLRDLLDELSQQRDG